MHDDDEERSRSIPARTKLGKIAAAIEKFPFLGTPLVLFGGLITVPFWGYRTTPLAMIDLMLSDLPRVEYGKDRITQQDIQEAKEKNIQLQERLKKGKGIGANLNNQIGTEGFLKSKIKGG